MEESKEKVQSRKRLSSKRKRFMEMQKKEAVLVRRFEVRSWFEEFFSQGKHRMEKKKEGSPFSEVISLWCVWLEPGCCYTRIAELATRFSRLGSVANRRLFSPCRPGSIVTARRNCNCNRLINVYLMWYISLVVEANNHTYCLFEYLLRCRLCFLRIKGSLVTHSFLDWTVRIPLTAICPYRCNCGCKVKQLAENSV